MLGRQRLRLERELLGAHLLVGGDIILMLERQIDVVIAVHQTPAHVVAHLERQGHVAASHGTRTQIDGHITAGFLFKQLPQQLDAFLRHDCGQHTVLRGVAVEDVGEAGGDDHAETVVAQRPHRVFARRADAEIRSGDQNLALLIFGAVEHEIRVAAPCVEQRILEPGFLDPLEEHGGDNLVGIHIRAAERNAGSGHHGQLFHNDSFHRPASACRPSPAAGVLSAAGLRVYAS